MAYDFVQSIPKLDAFALILPQLPLEMVPLTFLLLKFFLDRFLFFFYTLVFFDQSIYLGFELFDTVLSHGNYAIKLQDRV